MHRDECDFPVVINETNPRAARVLRALYSFVPIRFCRIGLKPIFKVGLNTQYSSGVTVPCTTFSPSP